MAEAAIRQRVADGVEAVRAKDIDAVMALYASNIVSFDIGPPLRYRGATINVAPGRLPHRPPSPAWPDPDRLPSGHVRRVRRALRRFGFRAQEP